MTTGELGGLIGAVIGVAGGVFGSYCSIRNAPPGPPRRFMIRTCIACFVLIALFLAGIVWCNRAAPNMVWILWIVYAPALFLGIGVINRRYFALVRQSQEAGASGSGERISDAEA